MDNINSHINVKFYYILNETTHFFSFAVISKNIFTNLKKLGKYSYFFKLELILTTLLNTCIILIVILKYFFFIKLPGEAGNVPLVYYKKNLHS